MTKFITLFLGLTGLALSHSLPLASKEPSFAKLAESLGKLDTNYNTAVESYHKNGFLTFEKVAKQFALSAAQKELLKTTPKDQPIHANPAVKKAYNQLKVKEFMLAQLSQPAHLADGFKAAILLDVVNAKTQDLVAEQRVKYDVLRIIAEENKAGRKFDKPSAALETLYHEMAEKRHIDPTFTSQGYAVIGENVRDWCLQKAGNCNPELTRTLTRYFAIDRAIQLAVPVDSAVKVEKLLQDMKEFTEVQKTLAESLKPFNLNCANYACEKTE